MNAKRSVYFTFILFRVGSAAGSTQQTLLEAGGPTDASVVVVVVVILLSPKYCSSSSRLKIGSPLGRRNATSTVPGRVCSGRMAFSTVRLSSMMAGRPGWVRAQWTVTVAALLLVPVQTPGRIAAAT